ncbi:pyridoxamine 5'-phosphate oxidase [PVC group bacterium (ex Bugula neritina AB1)]|nr:pyridoxamine 5'-phosphate oxidase [PVC group bacterium (ex Bugula neritina AB1)]
MDNSLSHLNRDYKEDYLLFEDMKEDPFEQFDIWFRKSMEVYRVGSNAMFLATSDRKGRCSVRTVLLKSYDKEGLLFYTNYNSSKARDIKENPWVSAQFHWPDMHRDIRVSGNVYKVDKKISESYFYTRPRESQIAVWASHQSQKIESLSRKPLERSFQEIAEKFENEKIPYPDFWGGYLIVPECFEFWQGAKNRLHDRIVYSKNQDLWQVERLAP